MEFLTKLADQGILGLLLAISLSSNYFLVKLLLAEKDKRITGAEKTRDDLIAPIGFIKESLDLIREKIQISKDKQ